ncbi:phage baseplate protein [Klebsiella aerogenes]|uniref:phage baseplate protein n=1 Tax=Klebsiella aerogenes TaxID=548 RepID=UPI0037D35CFB
MSFSLNVSTVLSAIQGGSLLSILNSALSPTYKITYNTVDESLLTVTAGQEVLTPSGWVSVDRYGDAMVTKGPVEKGQYSSYNKVRQPSELRIIFALEGWTAFSGALPNLTNFSLLSRNNFIQKLDEMKNTASTFDIETPDTVYYGYDLTHFDYFVGSYRGQTLLMANCTFEEIMNGGEVMLSNAVIEGPPTDNAKTNNGSAASTEIITGSTKEASLSDVKKAWSSANSSLSSALQSTGGAIVSNVNSAAESVSQVWDSTSTAVSKQIKSTVSDFLEKVM